MYIYLFLCHQYWILPVLEACCVLWLHPAAETSKGPSHAVSMWGSDLKGSWASILLMLWWFQIDFDSLPVDFLSFSFTAWKRENMKSRTAELDLYAYSHFRAASMQPLKCKVFLHKYYFYDFQGQTWMRSTLLHRIISKKLLLHHISMKYLTTNYCRWFLFEVWQLLWWQLIKYFHYFTRLHMRTQSKKIQLQK